MVTALHIVALISYLVVASVSARSLAGGGREVPRATGLVAVGGIIAHGTGLGYYTLEFGELPLVGLRSEEHTSELQSRGHLVCRLLLEKKKPTVDENDRTRHAVL